MWRHPNYVPNADWKQNCLFQMIQVNDTPYHQRDRPFCRAPGSGFTWVRKILVNSCWLRSFLETILGTYEKSSQFGVWNQGALADLDSLLFPHKVIWRASNWSRPPRNFQNGKLFTIINQFTQYLRHLWLPFGIFLYATQDHPNLPSSVATNRTYVNPCTPACHIYPCHDGSRPHHSSGKIIIIIIIYLLLLLSIIIIF